ncbi:MAG TPA: type II toxin-antitoxin system VapB family antitoxin [Geminicoccaceae bacterium]|nr:type II toxin-antitoxin system VapB family antitoxin [Geminicoccaceae bacterium]
MALNIRDPEVHRLARAVADATGETMTEAVKTALQDRLRRVGQVSEEERRRRIVAMREFARKFQEAPVLDPRTPDEILGYDENGLPT